MLWLLPLASAATAVCIAVGPWRGRGALAIVAGAGVAATLLLAAAAAPAGWQGVWPWSPLLVLGSRLDPASAVMAVLVPVIALPVVLYAALQESAPRRLVGWLTFFVAAMELLIIADDFLTLLVGWEIVGFCSWALISHEWRERQNAADAAQAFLITRFGDLGLFIAAAALWAGTDSFAYSALQGLDGPLFHVVAGGTVLSAVAKSAQAPFSIWLFRAMAGPASASALLHAATMVAAGAYLLIRLQPEFDRALWFAPTVIAVGLVTALAGGVAAVLQMHAKKLLAASTSAHYGLMLVALGSGHPVVALFHLVAHAFFKALLFLSAGIAGHITGSYSLVRMRLWQAVKSVALLTGIGSLALAGVPPLAGAWTKELVGAAAGDASAWLAAGVVVAGGLSACYAARFQWLVYGPGGDRERDGTSTSLSVVAVLALLGAPLVGGSMLWLPAVENALARVMSASLPRPSAVETAASLAAIAAGLYAGRLLARRPRATAGHGATTAAEWYGLPVLLRAAVIRPLGQVSVRLATIDDRYDAGIERCARRAKQVGRRLRGVDDAAVDGVVRSSARLSLGLSRALCRADGAAVDGGVRFAARAGESLAATLSQAGETVVDAFPRGSALSVAAAGRDARRLQTGMAHHYYVIAVTGAVVLTLILLVT